MCEGASHTAQHSHQHCGYLQRVIGLQVCLGGDAPQNVERHGDKARQDIEGALQLHAARHKVDAV